MSEPTEGLVEFLLARFTEDEVVARVLAGAPRRYGKTIARRRVADCEAKRRIVEYAAPLIAESERCADRDVPEIHDVALTAERILQLLALPYAEHPDYQPEWKPR